MNARIALTAAAIALVLPASAHADTFCVNAAGCALDHTYSSLNQAVGDAASNGVRDTISIGPGDLPIAAPVTVDATNPVDIVGAGQTTTRLAGGPGVKDETLLAFGPFSNSTVSDLSIRPGDGESKGLRLSGSSVGSRLSIEAPVDSLENGGVVLSQGATLTQSYATSTNGIAVVANATGDRTVHISDVTTGGSLGLAITQSSTSVVDARRLRLESDSGIDYQGPGTLRLSSSLITTTGASTALSVRRGEADVRHVTIRGDGTTGSTGAEVRGMLFNSGTLKLRDSTVTGVEVALGRYGADTDTFDLDVAYSNFNPARVENMSGGTYTPGPGNVNVSPDFRGPGDSSLAATSALIDAGDPAGLDVNESTTDLLGAARLTDGTGDGAVRSDIGAFEYPTVPVPQLPPPPSSSPPPAPAPALKDTIAPAVSAVSLTRSSFKVASGSTPIAAAARGTTLRYRLSEAAKVRIAIERRTTGAKIKRGKKRVCVTRTKSRRKAARCTRYTGVRTLTRDGKAGSNTVAFTGRIAGKALKPGRYRLTLTATDAAGNRSKPRTVAFRVVR